MDLRDFDSILKQCDSILDEFIPSCNGACDFRTTNPAANKAVKVQVELDRVKLDVRDEKILELHRLADCKTLPKSNLKSTAVTDKVIEEETKFINHRRSDEAMYNFAMRDQLFTVEFATECKSNCDGESKQKCCQKTTLEDVFRMRKDFWNPDTGLRPTREARKQKSRQLLINAFDAYNKTFKFRVGTRIVCEWAFLRILGLISSTSINKPEQWTDIRNQILNQDKVIINVPEDKRAAVTKKFDHAIVFIKWLADMFAEPGYFDNAGCGNLETRPEILLEESSIQNSQVNIMYLPYDHSTEVFAEYTNFYQVEEENVHPEEKTTCGISTFRSALAYLKDEIKLRTAKGGFETCAICNNLNDILKNTKLKWTRDQLCIVLKIKRRHLQQQSAERLDASLRKLKSKTTFIGRQPQHAYFEMDAYTEYKCLTPRNYQFRASKGDTKRLGNRIVGIIVVCGPIETRFVYSLNDLVYGGANTMIEVMRQAFHDLAVILAQVDGGGLLMPKSIYLQMDNCGENKNKYMFGYLTLLNQQGHFESIQLNFLIVGHTHGPIDQYFSILTNKLWDTYFVGSPMALQCLFLQCENPLVNRQIHVHYDYKSWLEPYLNKHIKHISLPHVFVISKELGLSILQHKAFSTRTTMLPPKPDGIHMLLEKNAMIASSSQNSVILEELGLLGGFDEIYREVVGKTVTKESLIKNSDQCKSSSLLSNLLDKLIDVDVRVAVETVAQMDFECDVGYLNSLNDECKELRTLANQVRLTASESNRTDVTDTSNADETVPRYERFSTDLNQVKLYQAALTKLGTEKAGYLMVLDYMKVTEEWLQSAPSVYNYYEQEDVMTRLHIVSEEIELAQKALIPPALDDVKSTKVKRRKQKESIFSKIGTIVTASKKMVADIEGKQYAIYPNDELNEKGELVPRSYCYMVKGLLQKEVDFYNQNSTAIGVLQTLNYHVQEERKRPYNLFYVVHFSQEQLEDQLKKQQELELKNKEIEMRVRFVLASKFHHPYYNPESAEVVNSGVLPHAQPGVAHTPSIPKTDYVCEEINCTVLTRRKCTTSTCQRYLCQIHFPPGGHKNHIGLSFKPKPTSTECLSGNTDDNINTAAECSEPSADANATQRGSMELETIDKVGSNLGNIVLCQVIECGSHAKHKCVVLDCRFTAICDMHYISQHASHACQMHVDDHIDKRSKTS